MEELISGINGSNCILESMAKIRIEKKMIDKAKVVGVKGNYIVEFYGPASTWQGRQMVLCSSRNPYEPRQFKSLDGAVSQLSKIGLGNLSVVLES